MHKPNPCPHGYWDRTCPRCYPVAISSYDLMFRLGVGWVLGAALALAIPAQAEPNTTACELNIARVVQNTFNDTLQPEVQECAFWQYHSEQHLAQATFDDCLVPSTELLSAVNVWGNNYAANAWRWFREGTADFLECHCDEVGGNGSCKWIR